MAGALNGLGAQQIPLANTFQPGQKEQVQSEDRAKADSRVKLQATTDAPDNDNDTETKADLRAEQASFDPSKSDTTKLKRGSLLDVTV